MSHLNREDILRLSKKILWEKPFDDKDIDDMYHISECDQCYEDLCCMLKIMDLTNHMDRYFKKGTTPTEGKQENNSVSAVICISVGQITSMLKQKTTKNTVWFFDLALPRLNLRSGKNTADTTVKLEDNDNTQSFIVFDKSNRSLRIQLDGRYETAIPKAFLRKADGTIQEVNLKKQGLFFCAEIQDMPDGEYELILETQRAKDMKTLEEMEIEEVLRCADPPSNTKFEF